MNTPSNPHHDLTPSPWVVRFAHLVPAGARVLDLACGYGRHALFFAARGAQVIAIDRDAPALATLAARSGIESRLADLEGSPWPLAGERFDAVVVTNYLWRPLWPALQASLADGAVLIYETFAVGNEAFGKPSNPDFLLRRGELLEACRGLHVVAYEDGWLDDPPRCVQRMAAINAPAAGALFAL